MNILMLSSSREEIDDYYKAVAKSISSYLASDENDLVFGGASSSMMGICYNEFKKQKRNIYAFTTPKYASDLKNLETKYKFIRETTFDLKRDMLLNSDLVVALPGGIGTLSEILSYIEEKRSNDLDTPFIIYDEDHYYDKMFEIIKKMEEDKFVGDTSNLYDIVHNKEEFMNSYDNCKIKRRKK